MNKIHDHAKYIISPKYNRFPGTIFPAKLKQVNLTRNNDVNAVYKVLTKIKKK